MQEIRQQLIDTIVNYDVNLLANSDMILGDYGQMDLGERELLLVRHIQILMMGLNTNFEAILAMKDFIQELDN